MKQKFAGFWIKGRYALLVLLLAVTVFFAVFLYRIHDMSAMTAFLPEDSPVRKGMEILSKEFGTSSVGSSIRLMGRNLSEDSKQALLKELGRLDYVKSVEYEYGSEDFNKGKYSLFVVRSDYEYSSREMKTLEEMIATHICPRYDLACDTGDTGIDGNLPLSLAATALLPFAVLSYRAGARMGVVPAKAVGIILIFAVTVLPSLLWMLNPLKKRRKKSGIAVFVLLFLFLAAGILLKSNLKTSCFMPQQSEIADIFPWTETIAVLYDTNEEEKIEKVAAKLEKITSVKKVTAYPITLGRAYAAADMTDKVTDMSQNVEIKSWMLPLIYYDYGGYEIPPMALGEFLGFLSDFAKENPELLTEIDHRMTAKLDILAIFADKEELVRSRTAAETAELFGIDAKLTGDLYQVAGKDKLSLAEFIQVVEKYSDADMSVPSGLMEQIELASLFTDSEEYKKERTPTELARIFGVEESLLSRLLKFGGKKTASIESLVGMVSSNSFLLSMLPLEITEKMYVVGILTDSEEMAKKRTADEISKLFGIDRSLLSIMGDERMSIAELMQLAKRLAALPDLTSMMDSEGVARIEQIMADTGNDRKYTPAEMTKLLESMAGEIKEDRISLVYKIYDSQNIRFTDMLTMEKFLEYAIAMADRPEYEGVFCDEMKSLLSREARKLADEKRQFVGDKYSVMWISAQMSEEFKENRELLETMEKKLEKSLSGNYYPVGNALLQKELAETFSGEFNRAALVICAALLLSGVLTVWSRLPRRARAEKKQ